MEKKLVTILIPTHNNAETLSRCLRSVLEQDYDNILVASIDNHSNDATYDILLDFEKQYRERLYTGRIYASLSPSEHRNRNMALTSPRSRFMQYVPPTDVLPPGHISRCVELIETSENMGCVMTHTDVILPSGTIQRVPKYLSRNGIIPGDTQMDYFMSHGMELNISPFYRCEIYGLSLNAGHAFNRFPTWLPLLMASSIADFGYIHESPMLGGTTRAIQGDQFIPSLEELFEQYLFLQAFCTIAVRLSRSSTLEKFPTALRRLSLECVRCARLLVERADFLTARSYLSLSLAYLPETAETEVFKDTATVLPYIAQDWQ